MVEAFSSFLSSDINYSHQTREKKALPPLQGMEGMCGRIQGRASKGVLCMGRLSGEQKEETHELGREDVCQEIHDPNSNKILLSTLSAQDQQLPNPMVGQSPPKAADRTSRLIP